jgi:integrase
MMTRLRHDLLWASVSANTAETYKKALKRFVEWHQVHFPGISIQTPTELDRQFLNYIHDYFDTSPTRGARQSCINCKCAILLVLPHVTDLPASSRALRGWDHLVQAIQRPPVSWGFVLFLFDWFMRRANPQYAIAVLLSTDMYLRVSELRNIRRSDISLPSGTSPGGIRLSQTKTGLNQSVVLRDPLVTSCLTWWLERCSQELIFDFSYTAFLGALATAQNQIGLSKSFSFTTHSFRHAGATRDHVRGLPLADIMLRGRWVSEKSARRYIQSGQALLFASSLPSNVKALCDRLEQYPNTLRQHLL